MVSFLSRRARAFATAVVMLSMLAVTVPTPTVVHAATRVQSLSIPDPAPDVAPGTLLGSVPIAGGGPLGAKAYRVVYASRSISGAPIAVTGFAYVPPGLAPKGGWPVLSYAHGTVGLADRCAPSRKPGAAEQFIGLSFVGLGMAVVATDYEGWAPPVGIRTSSARAKAAVCLTSSVPPGNCRRSRSARVP